jgi:hypothetical protein
VELLHLAVDIGLAGSCGLNKAPLEEYFAKAPPA